MNETRDLLERIGERFTFPDDMFERLESRRDRKRRNKRIAAGVVGIAVFVAAVWIVRDVALLDRTENVVVPGVSGTSGPTVTGPAETGPAVTGPAIRGPYEYDPTADYLGLPPEGAEPSGPERSELVAEAHLVHVGRVYVFEDGRVIANAEWRRWLGSIPSSSEAPPSVRPIGTTEQRLTPEGVELVRSGVIQASDFICLEGFVPLNLGNPCEGSGTRDIPPSAWVDSTLRPYVPYRYAIGVDGPWRMLPAAAQDLLRGKEAMFDVAWTRQKAGAYDITTEEARALDEILVDAGFYAPSYTSYERWWEGGAEVGGLRVTFEPILPHGTFGSDGGG
jgi:hypothetical protein